MKTEGRRTLQCQKLSGTPYEILIVIPSQPVFVTSSHSRRLYLRKKYISIPKLTEIFKQEFNLNYCLLCCASHCVMLLSLCCSVVIMLYSYCVALLLFVLSYVLIVCTVPLPPGVNPIAVDKYINISISYSTASDTGLLQAVLRSSYTAS